MLSIFLIRERFSMFLPSSVYTHSISELEEIKHKMTMGFSPPVGFFPTWTKGFELLRFLRRPGLPQFELCGQRSALKRCRGAWPKSKTFWDKGGKHHGNTGNMGNRVKIEICAKFWFQGDLKSAKPTFRPTVVLLSKKRLWQNLSWNFAQTPDISNCALLLTSVHGHGLVPSCFGIL